MFEKLDVDANGTLEVAELMPLINNFIAIYEEKNGVQLTKEQSSLMRKQLVAEIDYDQSGTIDELELRVYLTRKYDALLRQK